MGLMNQSLAITDLENLGVNKNIKVISSHVKLLSKCLHCLLEGKFHQTLLGPYFLTPSTYLTLLDILNLTFWFPLTPSQLMFWVLFLRAPRSPAPFTGSPACVHIINVRIHYGLIHSLLSSHPLIFPVISFNSQFSSTTWKLITLSGLDMHYPVLTGCWFLEVSKALQTKHIRNGTHLFPPQMTSHSFSLLRIPSLWSTIVLSPTWEFSLPFALIIQLICQVFFPKWT